VCGRFNYHEHPRTVAEFFGLGDVPDLTPRYNAAPSQPIPVVGLRADGSGRGMVMMRWGLVPRWAKDDRGLKPINARSESAADKPMFRDALTRRRCIIPASGFYEWDKLGARKVPYNFTPVVAPLFAMAGLWEAWSDPATGRKVLSAAVLTTDANELVAPVHDRMPVLIDPADFDAWLSPGTAPEAVSALLRPYPAGRMRAAEVGPLVNSPKNDGPGCVAPAARC
jgi:putative SOS response-associated peptidase YedK